MKSSTLSVVFLKLRLWLARDLARRPLACAPQAPITEFEASLLCNLGEPGHNLRVCGSDVLFAGHIGDQVKQ